MSLPDPTRKRLCKLVKEKEVKGIFVVAFPSDLSLLSVIEWLILGWKYNSVGLEI